MTRVDGAALTVLHAVVADWQPTPGRTERHGSEGHCCIKRSAHPSWSICPPGSRAAAYKCLVVI